MNRAGQGGKVTFAVVILASVFAPKAADAQDLGGVLPPIDAVASGEDPRGVRIAASLGFRVDGNVGLSASDEEAGSFGLVEMGGAGTISTGVTTLSGGAVLRREEPVGDAGEPRSGVTFGVRLGWTPMPRINAQLDARWTEAVEEGVEAPFQFGSVTRREARRRVVDASFGNDDVLGIDWTADLTWSDARFEDVVGGEAVRAEDRESAIAGFRGRRSFGFGAVESGLSRAWIEDPTGLDTVVDRGWVAVALGREAASTLRARFGIASTDGRLGGGGAFGTLHVQADWRPSATTNVSAEVSRDVRVAYVASGLTALREAADVSVGATVGRRSMLEAAVGAWRDEYAGGAEERAAYFAGTFRFSLRDRTDVFAEARWSRREFASSEEARFQVTDPSLTVGIRTQWE